MDTLAAAIELPRRIDVVLIGVSARGTAMKGADKVLRPRFGTRAERLKRMECRTLKATAAAEVCRILAQAGAFHNIWSHAFRVGGREFLLATHFQPARAVFAPARSRARDRKRRLTKMLPARLVVEVSPAPPGLLPRTLLHPCGPDIEERTPIRAKWQRAA